MKGARKVTAQQDSRYGVHMLYDEAPSNKAIQKKRLTEPWMAEGDPER